MTRLLVTPIDPAAPGSYRKRRRMLQAGREAQNATSRIEAMQAQIKADPALADAFADEMNAKINEVMDVQLRMEDLILQDVKTDDGSPVEAALDEISANDFDRLLKALLGQGDTVPNSTSASLPSGPQGRSNRRHGSRRS